MRPTCGTNPSATAASWPCGPASWCAIGYPDRFLVAHRELFNARHVHGRKIADREVVADVLQQAGVDAAAVLTEIDGGEPLDIVRKEHEAAVADFDVWGVPTVIAGDGASFIRVMNDAGGDPGRIPPDHRAGRRPARPVGPSSTSSSTPPSAADLSDLPEPHRRGWFTLPAWLRAPRTRAP